MTRRPLTIGAFRRWLENASPRLKFRARDSKMCPLARYLGNSRGNINVSVTAAWIESNNGARPRPTPPWAAYFIRYFDLECSGDEDVSPAQALQILLKSGYRKA